MSTIRDELSEEVDIPQEILHDFLVHRVGNLCDGLNCIRIYLDPNFVHNVSKKATIGQYKYDIIGIQGYPVFLALLKNFLEITQVA